MEKIKIGITIGDINGVGPEVIIKALANPKMLDFCTPIIYGSSKVVAYHKNIVNIDFPFQSIKEADQAVDGQINIVNCWQDAVNITLGKLSESGGKYAMIALDDAIADLKNGHIDAVVTAPINKKAMQMSGFAYPGHTELFNHEFGNPESVMLLTNDSLRIGLVTNHLPIAEVAKAITKERLLKKMRSLHETLRIDFGIDKPTIAVLGLNPHAGDEGTLGNEELTIIRPAIEEAKNKGALIFGPFSADGFFGSGQHTKFDAILAMYHDQGLIPFKAISFGSGVNYTAGLPIVRTSPDHGTAYDIAGQNLADETSMRKAIFAAIDIVKSRKAYTEDRANAIKSHSKSKSLKEGVDEVLRHN